MEELISKKDLLAMTNISYGQLYRWKRMNIIPEDWFIRKATPTGQETFFEREKILARIKLILSMKDDVMLDDIAEMLNKKQDEQSYSMEMLIEKGIIGEYTREVFYSMYGKETEIGKEQVLVLHLIEELLVTSVITMDELKMVVPLIEQHLEELLQENARIIVFRKYGVTSVIGCQDYKQVYLDAAAVKVVELDLLKEQNELKRKLL